MKTKCREALNVFIMLTAVILIWRGIWGLADLYLFSEDRTLSLFFSVVIGLLILFGAGKIYDLFDIGHQ